MIAGTAQLRVSRRSPPMVGEPGLSLFRPRGNWVGYYILLLIREFLIVSDFMALDAAATRRRFAWSSHSPCRKR
jgi:hypothetical protein